MFPDAGATNESENFWGFNDTGGFPYGSLEQTNYHKYVFFAVCSALLGLPSNILLLVILMRIGLFSKRQHSSSRPQYVIMKPTGSFERFLFEVVFIDTLLIIYHFIDNFLSYIHGERSAGQHYLIHVSDFCCKFFTYIAKMSVLLTTWLLLFLLINQLILSLEHNNNQNSCWDRGLYYVNAKYSTVFLIFIFSVYNIYPIEVLKYQKKEDLQDYQQEDVSGVCSTALEGISRRLLNASNYGYNILGVAIPCVIIFVISMIIIFRTCRNSNHSDKESTSFYYIAGTIGILHSLFILPARFSDILLLSLSPYAPFFTHLIKFNHEASSIISLSYGYKFFVCILISRRFRRHAKSVVCFLIENKYEDRHTTEFYNSTTNDWQNFSKRRSYKKRHRHHRNDSYLTKILASKSVSKKFSPTYINKDDFQRFITSESTAWIRPYFTQYEKRHILRPCGLAASCHQISTIFPSSSPVPIISQEQDPPSEIDSPSSQNTTNSSSACIINVMLPNGEYIHIPLPQKRASTIRSS
ncbi:unnamed protein product [Adineta steineri]|uniref:G-protein coupled receptors family 1 profile domain-containing protein n=1 Tax=Adineta steineri TaxID=433720 RepID=A0A814DYX6_9BILA|nr:unnamed protein product [Adineta steineri]CAF0961999.1 unnamed protein product [Adineta steineri]CAF0965653.1 unnamed protein product [Adineta steineri]CAF3546007.1 unnamed protein product [Adineta steineri]CAF4000197.1 unnamed protein product [Adineta steineri]